jgi:hypothetical protein
MTRLSSSEGAGDCRAEVDVELFREAGFGDAAGEAAPRRVSGQRRRAGPGAGRLWTEGIGR